MKKLLVFCFLVLFLIGWSVQSNAMMDKLASLGLDKKQTEYVKSVHLNFKKEVIRKRADIEIAEKELKEIIANDPVDIKKAEAKIRHIESLKSELKIMHLKLMEDIKSKLTPEQREKLASTMGKDGTGCGMGIKGICGMMHDMGEKDDTDSEGGKDMPMPPEMQHQHN